MPNMVEEASASNEVVVPGAPGVMVKEATGAWSGTMATKVGLAKPVRVVTTVSLVVSMTLTMLSAPLET